MYIKFPEALNTFSIRVGCINIALPCCVKFPHDFITPTGFSCYTAVMICYLLIDCRGRDIFVLKRI